MPAYPMDKMGNCPGPRSQGGPALAEWIIEKKGEQKKVKKKKQTDKREER